MSTTGRARSTGIPTPGRLRSYSSSTPVHESSPTTLEATTKAFSEAMKANDPSRYSGRSVSANNPPAQRPPSVASNPNVYSRPKTPSGQFSKPIQRPTESRPTEHGLQKQKEFKVHDDVRIESLGFEGKLRYVGEISGKSGLWAGVELSGGFAGLGKNNGSVGNVSYFACPEKCGVFVAYSKLSASTVSRSSHSRSSSTASSRASLPGPVAVPSSYGSRSASSLHNGRVTPSHPVGSGRVTPARSNGRVTPSSSLEISSSMTRTLPRPSFGAASSASNTPMSKITAGSRASKYVGVTAQQLSARSQRTTSPTRKSIGLGSPTRPRVHPSPSRSESRNSSAGTGTPKTVGRISFGMGTPKTSASKRPSLTTPRARIPSAVAMPPPPSPTMGGGGPGRSISLNDKPVTPTFSTTSNETAVDDEGIDSLASIQNNSRALKEKIQNMMSNKSQRSESPSRPTSVQSLREETVFGTPKLNVSLQLMQDRVVNLERDNSRLRVELDASRTAASKADENEALAAERDQALDKVKELETQLKSSERTLDERNSKVESLERSVQSSSGALQTLRAETDGRVNDLQAKLNDAETLVASLKEAIEVKSNEAGQNEGVIHAKDAEISLLEGRVKKATGDMEDLRRDLMGQIDELRHAGQETIALYEERLGVAETKRYQLEDHVDRLEEQIKRRGSLSRSVSGADTESAQALSIDNESLREQVGHLQNKIMSLEEMLEVTRSSLEREEAVSRARLQRHKENETSLRAELSETRGELEKLTKSESFSRVKAEEAEEALRENTITLDNAQAEIESLRAEIAALESSQARNSLEKSRSEDSSRIITIERERHSEEIAQLKDLLEAARNSRKEAIQELDTAKQDALSTSNSLSSLKQTVENLDSEKAELERTKEELEVELDREKAVVSELRRSLDEKTSELESSRKAANRDRPINVGLQEVAPTSAANPTTPSKDMSGYKDEIKGLKHIVQELQKEVSTLSARNKRLESENKMLVNETDSLRQELKVLEENIEQDILDEERALSSAEGDQPRISFDAPSAAKNKAEVDRLKKQLTDVEKKSSRTVHELNKEISELESLVEAKIYREDELEREIERLRHQQQSSKRSTKSSLEPLTPSSTHAHHSATSSTSTVNGFTSDSGLSSAASAAGDRHDLSGTVSQAQESEPCEICEQPGHDIFSCPLLKDGSSGGTATVPLGEQKGAGAGAPIETDLFCEDCEERGHLAANCPYSSDVF